MSVPGVVEGGWAYVVTAYGLTAAVVLGYAASLLVRYRTQGARRLRREEKL